MGWPIWGAGEGETQVLFGALIYFPLFCSPFEVMPCLETTPMEVQTVSGRQFVVCHGCFLLSSEPYWEVSTMQSMADANSSLIAAVATKVLLVVNVFCAVVYDIQSLQEAKSFENSKFCFNILKFILFEILMNRYFYKEIFMSKRLTAYPLLSNLSEPKSIDFS